MGIGECDKQYNYVYEKWSQLLLLLFIFVGKVWQNNDLWRLMSHVSRKKQGIRSFWFSQKNFGFSDYKPFTYPSTNSIFVFFIVLLNLKSLKATLPPTLWGIVFTFKNEKKNIYIYIYFWPLLFLFCRTELLWAKCFPCLIK